MLCKVHPELYIPPLTQPIRNAPDLYHFKRLGLLFCLGDAGLWPDGVIWSDLVVWFGSRWSVLMVWFGGRVWRWSVVVLGCGGLISDLIVWSGGLLPEEDSLVWQLKIEKITSWVDSSEMTKLSVSYVKRNTEKTEILYFFKIQLQLWKAGSFKPKKVCKNQTKHIQGSSDVRCHSFNSDVKHLGNHTDSVAICLSEGAPERSHMM